MSLAKDVAKQLERRARRRKIVILGVLAAVIAFLVTMIRCGGWGFGTGGEGEGSGKGEGKGEGKAPKAACVLRLDKDGLSLDGKKAEPEAAVSACKKAGRADVTVTGDARQGDWDALRDALDAAGVPHGTP